MMCLTMFIHYFIENVSCMLIAIYYTAYKLDFLNNWPAIHVKHNGFEEYTSHPPVQASSQDFEKGGGGGRCFSKNFDFFKILILSFLKNTYVNYSAFLNRTSFCNFSK